MATTSLIVAINNKNVIGENNKLPWHCPEDLKFFKETTMHQTLICGRKTYESLNKRPLPNRRMIVVTRNTSYDTQHDDVLVANSLDEAISFAKDTGNDIFIIGGATIYEQAIPMVDKMYITVINNDVDGDAYFPVFDKSSWDETIIKETPQCTFKVFTPSHFI